MKNSEHTIGEVIVHLQQLVCTNYRVLLPSVVFALSLMLPCNGLRTGDSDGNSKLIKSLCSRISSPPILRLFRAGDGHIIRHGRIFHQNKPQICKIWMNSMRAKTFC